jgi:hypothetical protein
MFNRLPENYLHHHIRIQSGFAPPKLLFLKSITPPLLLKYDPKDRTKTHTVDQRKNIKVAST